MVSSIGSPSIGGSTPGDIESQYADPIPFDGMGLVGRMELLSPHFEPTRLQLPGVEGPARPTVEPQPSCINPDILNHIGSTTFFPRDQTVFKNIPSHILELEPEGMVTLDQMERETDLQEDQDRLPGSSHQAIEHLNQDSASDHEDDVNCELEAPEISDSAEHSPSSRPASEIDSSPRAAPEVIPSDAHTPASSPESMCLDETDASVLVQRLIKQQVLDNLLQQFGFRMVKESDIKDQAKTSASSEPQNNRSGRKHKCDKCTKSFSRGCELRYVIFLTRAATHVLTPAPESTRSAM